MDESDKKEILETLRELVLACWDGLDKWAEKAPTREEIRAFEEEVQVRIKSLRAKARILETESNGREGHG
jgi:hypothetical protein